MGKENKTICEEVWSINQAEYGIKPQIKMPDQMYKFFIENMDREKECFWVITLNSEHRIINTYKITEGLINKTIVHPREVFRPAIKDNAAAIICIHNHPSGSNEPSYEDSTVSKRMNDVGEIVGIQVLDNMIFSKTGYYSFVENR